MNKRRVGGPIGQEIGLLKDGRQRRGCSGKELENETGRYGGQAEDRIEEHDGGPFSF